MVVETKPPSADPKSEKKMQTQWAKKKKKSRIIQEVELPAIIISLHTYLNYHSMCSWGWKCIWHLPIKSTNHVLSKAMMSGNRPKLASNEIVCQTKKQWSPCKCLYRLTYGIWPLTPIAPTCANLVSLAIASCSLRTHTYSFPATNNLSKRI